MQSLPAGEGDRGVSLRTGGGGGSHFTAPSPKRIADATHLKKPPRKNVVAKIISPLILHALRSAPLGLRYVRTLEQSDHQLAERDDQHARNQVADAVNSVPG